MVRHWVWLEGPKVSLDEAPAMPGRGEERHAPHTGTTFGRATGAPVIDSCSKKFSFPLFIPCTYNSIVRNRDLHISIYRGNTGIIFL
jgi:hypothetical protein